ncbi:non-specific lipid transfer protein GPI-anchored 7-like [Nymphaea colorata]|uniref:non-specific lipid transfer protein GPI-anchored 7-like n=1 Tax=Nymphaea colorata TaxID=210225 RepID=UPI00129DD41A|nr:non-specific lipid transfer protein GPI-anchored 7-like [Nymphaea colorata]
MRREMEGGAGGRTMLVMMVVAATMVASHIGGVGGQTQEDCAAKLIPCMDAVNNTSMKPGKECCSALGDAIKNELKCLCALYNSSGILENLKVNKTRALEIPGLCGLSNDLSHCSSAASVPSPLSPETPTSSPGSGKQINGALRITWSLKPLWTLGFLWMSLNMA